jgi:hypothetical protein
MPEDVIKFLTASPKKENRLLGAPLGCIQQTGFEPVTSLLRLRAVHKTEYHYVCVSAVHYHLNCRLLKVTMSVRYI